MKKRIKTKQVMKKDNSKAQKNKTIKTALELVAASPFAYLN